MWSHLVKAGMRILEGWPALSHMEYVPRLLCTGRDEMVACVQAC